MSRLLYCDGSRYWDTGFYEEVPPEEPEPPGELPADVQEAWDLIVEQAGVSPDSGTLDPHVGSMEVKTNGAVIEGLSFSGGIINIKANDVTIRDCDLVSYSGVFLIRFWPGFSGGLVEHCHLEGLANPGNPLEGSAGGVGGTSNNAGVTVQYCHIEGLLDGIKPMASTLMYRNFIDVYKAPGSIEHRDGIQGSADNDMAAIENAVRLDLNTGGNTGIFLQAWSNANIPTYRGRILRNICQGGNRGIEVRGGKSGRPMPPGYSHPDELIQDCEIVGNHLVGPFRYDPWTVVNTASHTISGNTYNGAPYTGGPA